MVVKESGTVYFLTNPSMPGLVKIGHTTGELGERVKQLSSTGTPVSFNADAAFRVVNARKCEKAIHQILRERRENPKREFFRGSVPELLSLTFEMIKKFTPTGSEDIPLADKSNEGEGPDDDDIYFMTYLLHDGYEQGRALDTGDLVEHHNDYSPLELEYKLLKLSDQGLVERQRAYSSGLGAWKLTPKGLRFMFDNGHTLTDLIEEARPCNTRRIR